MNSDCAFLNFADELLVKIAGFLPMKDRINVRAACSRLENLVAQTDLSMTRYSMKFDTFDGNPMPTPFGLLLQGMNSMKVKEFSETRSRLVKRIKLREVVMNEIDFERVNFADVRTLLTECSFETLFIVQDNIEYNERVESLIEEHRGKKIELSALYFPYFECIERLPATVELRYNYLHRQKVPSNGKTEDLLLILTQKAISRSEREQLVTLMTSRLESFLNSIGVAKTDGQLMLRDDGSTQSTTNQWEKFGKYELRAISFSFSHGDRMHVMTNGDTLSWISNRPFRMSMNTCPMHCELCESMKNDQESDNGIKLCDRCTVCRCVCFYRF